MSIAHRSSVIKGPSFVRMPMYSVSVVICLAGAALAQPTTRPLPVVIEAGGWVDPNGTIQTGALIVLEEGSIARIGGEASAGATIHSYPGAVVCPGLVDCLGSLGVAGPLTERERPVQPDLNASDAFNRYSRQLQLALAAGVTAFSLSPDDQNLIGGRIAVCLTGGADGPQVLEMAGPLKLSLSPDVFKADREPTSRAGALGLLRETLDAARATGEAPVRVPGATAPPRAGTPSEAVVIGKTEPTPAGAEVLRDFARGELPGVMVTPSGADVLAAAELARQYGLRLALQHTRDARDVAELAAERLTAVVVGPFNLASGPREAGAARAFERHNVPLAIGGGLPQAPADALRVGAAVAARAGLSPEAARRAITVVPAEVLNVRDRLGVLEEGRRADLVVFSADPLDLRARVLAVYVGGQRVIRSPEQPEGARP